MAIIKKFSPLQRLSGFQVFINDRAPNSEYFKITEFDETFTGGKNGFLIEGSEFLRETTEVKIEILDVEGNPIYYEPGDGIPEYYEGTSKLVSVHIYDDTPIGTGKITILGELKNYVDENGAVVPVPTEWRGIYNVKWEKTFQINKNLSNETRVRFYKRPVVSIEELVKPIFSKSIPSVTDSGTATGEAILPSSGTSLTNYRAGTSYRITRSSGSWDRDVDENEITFPSIGFSSKIIEVLNDRQVLVDIPYSVNNIVDNFTSQSYSVTYSDFQNEIIGETSLTGSFAKIDITQLKTFVGDVARVKVFRKSRNSVGDFEFVQESKLESTELLRDVTTPSNTQIPYGKFDETNLETYWITSSDDHPVTVDSSVLSQAVHFDYDSAQGGVQRLITSQSFSLSNDVEYTLSFRTILSGSLEDSGKSLRAYFSSSNFTQDFLTVSGSAIYRTRQNVSQNILSQNTGNAHLVFEVSGDDWYLSNVSLKNAQETSFSPDEFTLIQDIPRKLASETFDFRFEFYDINNNYIPIDVTAVGVFDGGNDFPTSGKLLTFESDRNAFRFSSGSVQNPTTQQIQFKITQNNLTGSVTFASSAFDVDGNYLNPSEYDVYPGGLTSVTPAGGLLTINNFTGSRTDGNSEPFVGSIVYTASLDSLQEFETVYRLEDGDNAPQLIVTSNSNQFIYEPTTLSPKPSGQSITIRAQRKNLASLSTPITVDSGSNRPPLTYVDTVNGIDTYTISALEFSSSFASNVFDEVTYSFTGSDVFGNEQYDEITLSKVINFDGVSIVLSNESTSFPAKSTGEVTGGFVASSGSVQMYIGGNQIQHDDEIGGRSKNTFNITSSLGTNVTPTDETPNTADYSISAFETTKDSGSLLLTIDYLAGDSLTTQSFQKVVSYTKAKKAVPTVLTKISPSTQTINSSSAGFETPQTMDVILQEGGTEYTYNGGTLTPSTFKITGIGVSAASASHVDETITINSITSSAFVGLIGSASVDYQDSEGTTVTNKLVRFDLSVSKVGVDGQNGSNGVDNNAVSLSANRYTIPYDGNGAESGSNTITLTAGSNITGSVYYEFQGSNDGGTTWIYRPQNTTSNTYTLTNAQEPKPSSVTLWQVNARAGSNSGSILAFDNIDVFGVQDGTDAYTAFLTNEAHTLPTSNTGTVTYTGSGTSVVVFKGATEMVSVASSPTSGQFSVTTDVTTGTITVGDQDVTGNPVVFADHEDMQTDLVIIEYTLNVEGVTTIKKYQTLSKAKQGTDGINGSNGTDSNVVTISANQYTIPYDGDGNESGTNTITLTANTNATGSVYYQFRGSNDGGSNWTYQPQNSVKSTYILSQSQEPGVGEGWLWQVDVRDGNESGSILAFDNTDVFGLKEGSDAYTVFLTNEAHTYIADSSGLVTQSIADGAFELRVFRGTTQYTYDGTSPYDANSYRATFTATGITGSVSTVSSQAKWTPSAVNGVIDAGTVSVNIIDNTTGTSFIKNYTYTKSKKGKPSVVAVLSSEAQTITKSAAGVYGTPSTFTVSVNEGGINYTYDATSPYGNGTFRISSISGGTNSTTTVTPTTPTTDAGTTVSMTITYVNSDGVTGTITKTHKVGVTTDGTSGTSGVTISPSLTSQNVVRDFEAGTFGSVSAVSHSVRQTTTAFTAVASTTALGNSQYRVKPSSLTNCTETANGVITPTQPSSGTFTTGGTASYTIQYKDGDGNANEIEFTHVVNVTTNGTTGPGLVFSGEWASGTQYQFSTGATGRRDAVIYSGTYYAATAAHTSTDNTSSSTGRPGSGPWESLGTGTRFSAAEMTISKQSYIKETLTIGTNNIGSAFAANITAYGGNAYPYIAIGQQTAGYNLDGIWLGRDYNGGTPKYRMSLVNGTTSFMRWTGDELQIKGNINATSGTFTGELRASSGYFSGAVSVGDGGTMKVGVDVNGSKDGIHINGNNYWYNDGAFKVGNASSNMSWDTTTLQLNGSITATGTITGGILSGTSFTGATGDFSGTINTNNITATYGTIGGWGISGDNLVASNMTLQGGSSPAIQVGSSLSIFPGSLSNIGAGSGAFSGNITTRNSQFGNAQHSSTGVTNTTYNYSTTRVYSPSVTVAPSTTGNATWSGNLYIDSSTTTGTNYYWQQWAYTGNTNSWAAFYATERVGIVLTTSSTAAGIDNSSTVTSAGGNVVGVYYVTVGGIQEDYPQIEQTEYNIVWGSYSQPFSKSVSVSAGTTYYAYTFVDSLTMQIAYQGSSKVYWEQNTPITSNLALEVPLTKTELTTGGFQTVHSNVNYFRVALNPSYNSVSTVSALVGGSLEATGNVTANTSDRRFKDVHGNIDDALNKIKKINGIVYHSNELAKHYQIHEERQQVGLIAQELEEVLPEAVTRAPFDNDGEGNSKSGQNYLTIWYERVVPLLVEGIKELSNKVESLQEEIKKLKE